MHALLILPAVLLAAPEKQDDAKSLQGTWSVVSFQAGKEKVPAEKAEKMTLTIKDNTFSLSDGQRTEAGTFKLDPAKSPKQLDLTVKDGKETALFIYELNGDELKLCWRKPEQPRPEKFTAEGTDGLMVLKRKK
jgi:uncharacterized protein (TIGR03067 family)